jgi:WhiB family redox-sensing transcriptional regulator
MMIRTTPPEQVRAWLALAVLADEVGNDHLPCRQAPDVFFGTQGEHYLTRLAVEACNSCPIKQQCAEYAITFNGPEGIWGGTTAGERKRLRRSRKN